MMDMVESIVTLFLLLMLLVIIVIIFFSCKPWRFFFSPRFRSIKVGGELERPLVSELERRLVSDESDVLRNQSNELPRDYDPEGACFPNEARAHGLVHKQRLPSGSPNVLGGDSLVLEVVSDSLEDIEVGQTLKRPPSQLAEIQKHSRLSFEDDRLQDFVQRDILDQRSCLTLEVISGPASGRHCSVQSTNPSRLPLTLGRLSNDIAINDKEVSGKHALIQWNSDKMKWEVVDMGSLNGTYLNSQPIHHPDIGSRHWGDPIGLANGDIIKLGTTSQVIVHITSQSKDHIPFGVGMASDAMAVRRGGKKLPMEDVCYYQWPLTGLDQFGLFGVCDGHGGDGAAKSASKLLPEMVANLLSDSLKRERVLSLHDASDVLREAFCQTEACLSNQYEGCTATVLLVWADGDENFFAQCANVGDSTCIMNVDGQQLRMSEDHKITNISERLRIGEAGEPLKDGETRLYGINLGRMLGDKFLKQQDPRFSSEPYISEVVHIGQASKAFALLASDGLWDVISTKKAVQLVQQMREKYSAEGKKCAEKIANFLLDEAKTLRTRDNTSVIFLDFDSSTKFTCKAES
ncbi:hypothetical protein L6164_012704 [Bauhinia variegata]|uniref:Uncharacterized protein n=1 Tax=Bauhinia variegata TaxID=167791 RepID=A0ACB9PAY4_BAUVA|nr:hypothetical protein L6164_012704 [Bauhinia variegata]